MIIMNNATLTIMFVRHQLHYYIYFPNVAFTAASAGHPFTGVILSVKIKQLELYTFPLQMYIKQTLKLILNRTYLNLEWLVNG